MVVKIAQISDLHFANASLNPLQFFSKRWLGNLNALLSRKKVFCQERLRSLAGLLKEEKVSHLLVTGDISTTSHPKEFSMAQQLFSEIEERGISVHVLPGNHDNYTKRAFRKKTFYKFFDSPLQEKGVFVQPLAAHWWLVTLDTTLATSLISSQGKFSELLHANLLNALSFIPSSDQVILANHFPLFEHESPRKALLGAEKLRELIQEFPNIIFYMHGHTHAHCIADLRNSGLPIILDCGSTPHHKQGAFHLVELEKSRYTVKVFRWKESWQLSQEQVFYG
jgi:3',5'-cyclic AMP phosphodiesterase CpdA